jgi:hypothetical protein
LLLLLGFVIWLARASYRAFVRQNAVAGRQARAGAIVMWLLLTHSLWDYPLRTIALETLFGFCAALQFAPRRPRTSIIFSIDRGANAARRVPEEADRAPSPPAYCLDNSLSSTSALARVPCNKTIS